MPARRPALRQAQHERSGGLPTLPAVAVFAAAWALFWTWPKWSAPLMNYEWAGYLTAVNWAEGRGPVGNWGLPYFVHPPFYLWVLSRCLQWAGVSIEAARASNAAYLVLQAAAIVWLARAIGAARYAALAAGLYLACPAVLQGVLLTDLASDNSLLTLLSAAALALAAPAAEERGAAPRLAALALLSALCFWAKPTTALALPAAFVGLALLGPTRGEALRGLSAVAAGGAAFVASWWLYCRASGYEAYFSMPFLAFTTTLPTQMLSLATRMGSTAAEALRAVLWISPYWAALCVWQSALAVAVEEPRTRLLRLFVGIVFGVYTVLGQHTTAGCFKYAAPALPALCVLLALAYGEELKARLKDRSAWRLAAALAAAAAWHYWLVGDPLFTLNRGVRESAALGLPPPYGRLGLQFAASAAAAAGLGWVLGLDAPRVRGGRLGLTLLLSGVAWHLALDARQRSAAYLTGAAYGTDGFEPAVRLVRSHYAGEKVLARGDLTWQLDPAPPDELESEWWLTTGRYGDIFSALRSREVGWFVFGLGSNPIGQVRRFLTDPDIRKELEGYDETRLGDYWVYRRRAPRPEPLPAPTLRRARRRGA